MPRQWRPPVRSHCHRSAFSQPRCSHLPASLSGHSLARSGVCPPCGPDWAPRGPCRVITARHQLMWRGALSRGGMWPPTCTRDRSPRSCAATSASASSWPCALTAAQMCASFGELLVHVAKCLGHIGAPLPKGCVPYASWRSALGGGGGGGGRWAGCSRSIAADLAALPFGQGGEERGIAGAPTAASLRKPIVAHPIGCAPRPAHEGPAERGGNQSKIDYSMEECTTCIVRV